MDSRKPMTAGEIEAIREMRSKATPGPVEFCVYGSKDKAWLKRELCNLVDSSPEAEFHFVGTPDGLVVAHTGNGPTSKDNARFLAVMINEFDRLLSLLTPPPDAAVREAVEFWAGAETCPPIRSRWAEFRHHALVLLRAVQAQRLTGEQMEAAFREGYGLGNDDGRNIDVFCHIKQHNPESDPDFAWEYSEARRAAFPGAFAGEVGRG